MKKIESKEQMSQGDFVYVKMSYGSVIGKLLAIRDGVMDVEFDNGILTDIPERYVMLCVHVNTDE